MMLGGARWKRFQILSSQSCWPVYPPAQQIRYRHPPIESSVSISVSNPQRFLSELEDMETSQILEELKISDGGYVPKIVFRCCPSGLSWISRRYAFVYWIITNWWLTRFEALVITGIEQNSLILGRQKKRCSLQIFEIYFYRWRICRNSIKTLDEWLSESDGFLILLSKVVIP